MKVLLQRWNLVVLMTVILIGLCVSVIYSNQDLVEGVRAGIRITARSSLIMFCLAFVASALQAVLKNNFTAWLQQQRRFLGLSFGVSHLIHGILIIAFARLDPILFHANTNLSTYIFGITGYVFIFLMLLTSFHGPSQWIGPAKWKALHRTGGYVIWFVFFSGSLKRALTVSSAYWGIVAVLATVIALRLYYRHKKN